LIGKKLEKKLEKRVSFKKRNIFIKIFKKISRKRKFYIEFSKGSKKWKVYINREKFNLLV
jgi:hypothetical protein